MGNSPAYDKVTCALAVMVLDPKIRAYLETHDPKALLQALGALQSVGYRFPQPEVANNKSLELRGLTKDLYMPAGLPEAGVKAYDVVMAVLMANEATTTGGCKAFYSPQEWEEREEEFGQGCELIVVYDGGDLARFFSLDHGYPKYAMHSKMRVALESAGLFAEECTGWYSAIYRK